MGKRPTRERADKDKGGRNGALLMVRPVLLIYIIVDSATYLHAELTHFFYNVSSNSVALATEQLSHFKRVGLKVAVDL